MVIERNRESRKSIRKKLMSVIKNRIHEIDGHQKSSVKKRNESTKSGVAKDCKK